MLEMNKVHLLDCLEGMADIPDKYFELAIVDPPYGVGAADGSFGRGLAKRGHTASPVRGDLPLYANHDITPDSSYFAHLFRISKNQIIWGANYYPEYLHKSGGIVWDKQKDCNPVLSDAELAFQSFDNVVKIFRHTWFGFAKGSGSFERGQTRTIHPNQKPVALYKWLLSNYAKPGDKILDTHVGSGSSIIACIDMGFEYMGFEIDEDYYKAMQDRIYHFTRQGKLL